MLSTRRQFLEQLSAVSALPFWPEPPPTPLFFQLSLAQWSLHRALFKNEITSLDFPGIAQRDYGIAAVEYVDQFLKNEPAYLTDLLRRSQDAGVVNHLIMLDTAGNLVDADPAQRASALDQHYAWAEAAARLGCRTIRVNLRSGDAADQVRQRAIDSMGRLAERVAPLKLNVVAENHGGHSSDGGWMASVAQTINRPNCGLLPDFGNFCQSHEWGSTEAACARPYDRYQGVAEMLPYAKGAVSAKSYAFDAQGRETTMDYERLLSSVKAAGFTGYIGIEFEGATLQEPDGIRQTKALLERIGQRLSIK